MDNKATTYIILICTHLALSLTTATHMKWMNMIYMIYVQFYFIEKRDENSFRCDSSEIIKIFNQHLISSSDCVIIMKIKFALNDPPRIKKLRILYWSG